MRPAVPSVAGLLLAAVAMVVSSCATSNSPSSVPSSGSGLAANSAAASSPAAGSASASASPASSPAPACPVVPGWPIGSRSPAPAGQLFVAGSPTLATLCQYVLFTAVGSSAPPPVLVQISGPALSKLIAALNALVPTNDEPPCPAPQLADVLAFVGAGLSSTVRVDLQGGCQFVWSDTGVHAYASNALLQQLDAIVANAASSASPATWITVNPAIGLIGGQKVQVTVTGFPVEAKVWLSECATAADVNPFGCGNQLAGMPFLMTDDTGRATGSFTVTADLPAAAEGRTTQACTTCVLAAVMGDAPDTPPTPTASTALAFAPTGGSPSSGA